MKYIEFVFVLQKTKTAVYAVKNIKSQNIIGRVKWYSCWRQYCFFPESNTTWSTGCLREVMNFSKLPKNFTMLFITGGN